MKNDRLRVPVDDNYLKSLGMAIYAFARLEWDAVWCCERMSPGIINDFGRATANDIADRLRELADGLSPSTDQSQLRAASDEFKSLVRTRNAIVHAKPGTTDGGAQRLFRDGTPWTVEMLDDASDSFTECSLRLNGFLHGFLSGQSAT